MAVLVEWAILTNNLLDNHTAEEIAGRAGTSAMVLEELASGHLVEPRFYLGTVLLDLHYELCRDKHSFEELEIEVTELH